MNPALRAVLLLASRLRRVNPGDYILDESRNYITDQLGNRLIG